MEQVKKKEVSGAFKKLSEWLETPEGKTEAEKALIKMERDIQIKNAHVELFHKLSKEERDNFIKKTITKYNSDDYINRWYNRGIFPPQDLYSLFFDYGEKYGIPQETDNPFGNSKFLFDDKWIVEIMFGQGTVISILEKDNE